MATKFGMTAAMAIALLSIPPAIAQEAELIAPPPFEAPLGERSLLASARESSAPVGGLGDRRGPQPLDRGSFEAVEPEDWGPPVAGADLRLRLELPSFGWDHDRRGEFIRQVTLTRLPPGSLILKYEGFHGFAVRKATQRMRSVWLDSLEDMYDAGTLDDEGLRDALRTMGDAIADSKAGGRWWDRAWWEHMPAEKGGAPQVPLVHTVGERLDVIRLGPLRFTNDFKGKLDRLQLSLEPDSERVIRSGAVAARLGLARDHARIDRDDDAGDRTVAMARDVEDSPSDAPLLRLLFEAPNDAGGGLLAGTGWTMRIRPAVRLNLDMDPVKAFRDVSLRVMFEWSRREHEPSMIEIEALVRFVPKDQDLRAGVQFSFFFF